MDSVSISASLQTACSSSHHIFTQKQQPKARLGRSVATKQATDVVSVNVDGQKGFLKSPLQSNDEDDVPKQRWETEYPAPKFSSERWKKGTWDLNMFVSNGKMDWNALIVAEARRRRFPRNSYQPRTSAVQKLCHTLVGMAHQIISTRS